MLSRETEMKIIKLLIEISNGHREIESIKQKLTSNLLLDPSQIFFYIDQNRKGKIDCEDLKDFLNRNDYNCLLSDSKHLIYFYDKDLDGCLTFPEFLNLFLSDSSYSLKKIAKKKFKPNDKQYDIPEDIEKAIADSFNKEIDFTSYALELISDIKAEYDFNIQDLYYSMKSYSFITSESMKAFFDRNDVNYTEEDIKAIFNRINIKRDGKICFNEFKGFFDLNIGHNDEEVLLSMSMSMSRGNNFNRGKNKQFECLHLSRSNSPNSSNEQMDCCNNDNYVQQDIQRNIQGNRCNKLYNNQSDNEYISNNNNMMTNDYSLYSPKGNDNYSIGYNPNTSFQSNMINKQQYDSCTSDYESYNMHRMNKNLTMRKSPQRKQLQESYNN